jgi:hypothetical protein
MSVWDWIFCRQKKIKNIIMRMGFYSLCMGGGKFTFVPSRRLDGMNRTISKRTTIGRYRDIHIPLVSATIATAAQATNRVRLCFLLLLSVVFDFVGETMALPKKTE